MEKKLLRSIQFLKGVGEKRAKMFEKLGIQTVYDLITFFPRDYEDRTAIKTIADTTPEENVCICATVCAPVISRRIRKGLEIAKTTACDDTGTVTITFFNQKFLKDSLKEGNTYVFYGKVKGNLLKRELQNPTFEKVEDAGGKTGRIMPVYPLTAGITQNILRKCIENALEEYENELGDPLSEDIRSKYNLAHASFAYKNIHFPEDQRALEIAKRRISFEELYIFSVGLMLLKGRRNDVFTESFEKVDLTPFYKKLPFALTGAQERTVREAVADMLTDKPMNRLVQGDVGSGKTVVAAICAYAAFLNNRQTALMAPTEILAEQHFESFKKMFDGLGVCVELICGSHTAAKKREIKTRLADGEIDIIIGTHALITDDVSFKKLGLVVTDEQHRFGVRQRSSLIAKGENPHLLVMSATPIPRTLALILYGDLDISVIDELPPGRLPVDTFAIGEDKRARAYAFVSKHLAEGRQAYIVCPLVEENEESELKAASEFAKRLQENELKQFKVDFIHGRMKGKEKEAIMRAFSQGETDVLVSTTVIEVGVNVPNAVMMVIENAERFGLSQLHQLRGRVGRGEHKSYCIMFSENPSEVTAERLGVMCKTNDGFVIAEEDLRLRGPGDLFGTRQHGVPELKIANLAINSKMLKVAQAEAKEILKKDPMLSDAKNKELASKIRLLFREEEYGDIFN